jgi:hypothetical protein
MKNTTKKTFWNIALITIIGFGVLACQDNNDGGGQLKGTYVSSDSFFYTFSGNKATMTYMGVKEEGTFEVKDGKYYETNSNGKTTEFAYSLEGNKLTIGEGQKARVFTKQ